MFRRLWACTTFEEGLDVRIDRSWYYSEIGAVVDRPEIVITVVYDDGDTKDLILSKSEAEGMANALWRLTEDIAQESAGGKGKCNSK